MSVKRDRSGPPVTLEAARRSGVPIQLGFLCADLPDGWEHEMTIVSRAESVDGYRPTIRISYASVREHASIEELGREYEVRLRDGLGPLRVTRVHDERLDLGVDEVGVDEALELSFDIEMDRRRSAVHRVLLARREDAVVTVAESVPVALGEAKNRGVARSEAGEALTRVMANVMASLRFVEGSTT